MWGVTPQPFQVEKEPSPNRVKENMRVFTGCLPMASFSYEI